MKKTMTVELIGYDVYGEATISMWGGGQGTIDMDRTRLRPGKCTRDNIMRCVNDGGFGAESIDSAYVCVTEVYSKGARGKTIRIESDSDRDRGLYLGWKKLREDNAIMKL